MMQTHVESEKAKKPEQQAHEPAKQGAQMLDLQKSAGNAAVTRMLAGGLTLLGTDSWQWALDPKQRVVIPCYVGSAEAWKPYLKNMDDSDEFRQTLQGFLKYANNPGAVGDRTSIWNDYQTTVTRAPNQNEKLEFLKALYSLKDELDLWHGSFGEAMSGESFSIATQDTALALFLQKNQGLLIRHLSEQGKLVDSAGVKAVATQGGGAATHAMIADAGVTAHQAVGLIMAARKKSPAEQDRAALVAMETIRNSGRVIRSSLSAHNARIQFEQEVVGQLFDAAWGLIPGGKGLSVVAKGILKGALKEGLKRASEDKTPNDQAEKIATAFIEGCNQLAIKGLISNRDTQDAINGFEAVRRPGVND
jgi:hypothetical protein